MSNVLSVVFARDHRNAAESISCRIASVYAELEIELIELTRSTNPSPSGGVVALLFDEEFNACSERTRWLTNWNEKRASTPLLPIALDSAHGRPPNPISGLKARFAVGDEKEVLRSIGAMLGLALRPGKNKVFVSYRGVDGTVSARRIYDQFIRSGYCAWLDEGKDTDDNPNLELGADVQKEIEDRVADANALILVDTPEAPSSKWIRFEVALAVGKMIPIYPVVLHPDTEETSRGRFRVLQGLNRRICIESTVDSGQYIFDDANLPAIVANVEEYLLRVYQNRVVQPRELERWFVEQKWEFGVSELRPHLHHAKVGRVPDLISLLACCSFEDIIFAPRLQSFVEDIQFLSLKKQAFTRNLFLYPGATQNPLDIEYLMTKEVPDIATLNALLLSYNEAIARISAMTGGYYVP